MLYKEKRTYPRIFGLERGRIGRWGRARLAIQKFNTKVWYQLVSFKAEDDLTFMNFGYAPHDNGGAVLELAPSDECNRLPTQLYNRVIGATDLRGKDVLEVGSGRGGGSAFVDRHFRPRSMTGVDFCSRAVAFCRRRHGHSTLSFKRGDAEKLPFPAASFDAVVNVESCHCYVSVERFLEQVVRVLRQGGHFLFADVGPRPYILALREQLGRCGLSIVEEEDITSNVVRALAITSERNTESIQEQVPPGLRSTFRNFSGVEGSPVFGALSTGEWLYVRFLLEKT